MKALLAVLLTAVFLATFAAVAVLKFNPDEAQAGWERLFDKRHGIRARMGYLAWDWQNSPVLAVNSLLFRHDETKSFLLRAKQGTFEIDFLRSLQAFRWLPQSLTVSEPKVYLAGGLEPLWSLFPQEAGERLKGLWGASLKRFQIERGTLYYRKNIADPGSEIRFDDFSAHIRITAQNEAEISMKTLYRHSQNRDYRILFHGVLEPALGRLNFMLKAENDAGAAVADLSGILHEVNQSPWMEFNLHIDGVEVAQFLGDLLPVGLHGILTARAEGRITALKRPFDWGNFGIQGALDIRNGGAAEFDLVKTALQAMGIDLGAVELEPEHLKPLLANGVLFDTLQLSFGAAAGKFRFSNILLVNDFYTISGNAQFRSDPGRFEMDLKLVMLDPIAESIIREHRALRPYLSREGRLVIPMECAGKNMNQYDIVIHRPEWSGVAT